VNPLFATLAGYNGYANAMLFGNAAELSSEDWAAPRLPGVMENGGGAAAAAGGPRVASLLLANTNIEMNSSRYLFFLNK